MDENNCYMEDEMKRMRRRAYKKREVVAVERKKFNFMLRGAIWRGPRW